MAKIDRTIAFQQRQLTPEQFQAWVAINPQIAAHLEKKSNIPQAEKDLERLEKQILKEVVAPALKEASQWLATIERANVPVRSGTLRQAIGSIDPKIYQGTLTAWIASGPRRGYARAVVLTTDKAGKPKLKKLSLKATKENPHLLIADPTKYAHLVMGGRKAVRAGFSTRTGPTGKKALFDRYMGRFFGTTSKAARANDFMADAESSENTATNIAWRAMDARLQALTNTGG